ncbi:hypothetical protein [Paenibacillus sp. DYY-L-2]|uniref:hypothetical protein n=1 Tax=Paenibacillus sp. DYY-L-2 TaxID=3447013 RepID=UPI003F4F7FFB
MKFRKADEMEQYMSDRSAKYGFIFYTLALLVWSLVHFFTQGETGWEFSVMLGGCVVYFGSRVLFNRKLNK